MAHSRYLSGVFNHGNLSSAVIKIEAALRYIEAKEKKDIDIIAFSGVSGSGVCFPLYHKYKRDLAYVRKAYEYKHCHGGRVETTLPNEKIKKMKRYVIVDDLVAQGNTVRHIISQMKRLMHEYNNEKHASCIYVITYNDIYNYEDLHVYGIPIIDVSSLDSPRRIKMNYDEDIKKHIEEIIAKG